MPSQCEMRLNKKRAIAVTSLLFVLFVSGCLGILFYQDKGAEAFILIGLFLVYLLSHVSFAFFAKEYLDLAFNHPLESMEKELLKRTSGGIAAPERYNRHEALALAINASRELTQLDMAITDNSPFPVALTDSNGLIRYANPTFDTELFEHKLCKGSSLKEKINELRVNAPRDEFIEVESEDGNKTYYRDFKKSVVKPDEVLTLHMYQCVDDVISLRKRLDGRFKTDELTSLNTRFYFNDLADDVIYRASDKESHFLALIDINDFKILNDSAGHDVGDLILMELANIIRSHTTDSDILGRISGDEFAILFRNKEIAEVEACLTKLHIAIKEYKIEHFDTQIGVSVSIGVAKAVGGNRFIGIRGTLQQADLAVITAKKNGFIFKVYDESDTDIVFYREAPIWINRIKSAISENNFEIFVQEISPFDKSKVLHLEVLLRMKDGCGGYYPPYKFFDVAEKFNLTKAIDEWVVENSFKNIAGGTMSNCRVSINLSGDTIKDSSAIEKILFYSSLYRIDASNVLFEITETMAIDDLNQALSNIETLRSAGFSIALDDFGSGFSTFKYIQSIPADYIKIDGIFVKNAYKCERDRAIVSNIVSIAHELNMACVAEFVEDERTLLLMKKLGVDYIQGYYVHKPLPASEWEAENSLQQNRLHA